jgi:hypothetical protein
MEEDAMVRLLLAAGIFITPLATVVANGHSDGGYIA